MNKKQAIKYLQEYLSNRTKVFAEHDWDAADELGLAIRVLLNEVEGKK